MSNAPTQVSSDRPSRSGGHALLVASGILLSRVSGLVRQRAIAHFFGNSDVAGAFAAALRIPNYLQNLFGEGVLSASFIPVYSNLLARGDEREAGRVAGAILSLLALVTSLLVVVCVVFTPHLIALIAPGFEGETQTLTIRLVRIMFPGVGILVLSAWCLGVLNSHGRFLLSYSAPVVLNVTMVAALVAFGVGTEQQRLAEILAWSSVVGSALMFAVQLPVTLRLVRNLRLSLDARADNVRTVVRNFAPVFVSRGVVQISAYVDSILASLVSASAMAALFNAQQLYVLPVSLFGMSVSAAELPAMSSLVGSSEEVSSFLRQRLDGGLRRIAFFIVPSAMGFLALGDVIAGALYQSGRFTRDDSLWVWGILAGSTVGLLASTLGRLYSSAFYALRDTRTPLMFAVARVSFATALGYVLSTWGPGMAGVDPKWGVAGITVASGLGGWLEFALLRSSFNRRVGRTGLPASLVARLWAAAAIGAAVAWVVKLVAGPIHPIALAGLTLVPFGLVYCGLAWAFGVDEARSTLSRILRLVGRVRR